MILIFICRQLRSLSENESDDPSLEKKEEFLSLPVTANLSQTLPPSLSSVSTSKNSVRNSLGEQRARPVIKSFSATGLSLMIPPGVYTIINKYIYIDIMYNIYNNNTYLLISFFIESSSNGSQVKSPGSCSALNSPCRDVPLITSLKPPIILRRGPSGFGFTVNTIRVYYGDSDFYTMHHLVMVCKCFKKNTFIYLLQFLSTYKPNANKL